MGFWTASRFVTTALIETVKFRTAKFVNQGIRNLYRKSFDQLHRLDIIYHKSKSKDTVIEINKALKSGELGAFYFMSDTLRHLVEFSFISAAYLRFCGLKYFAMFMASALTYTIYTWSQTKKILPFQQKETQLLKNRETYQMEQIMLYDTVHQFGNQGLSTKKHDEIIGTIEDTVVKQQYSLNWLMNIQLGIMDVGTCLNLMMAAFDVYAGRLSPGGFVLVGSLFEQLGSVLEWQSWYMRCYTQATVDVEPLYHMLNTDPIVKQKEDAKKFEYKEGAINFENITFKHYFAKDDPENTNIDPLNKETFQVEEKTIL